MVVTGLQPAYVKVKVSCRKTRDILDLYCVFIQSLTMPSHCLTSIIWTQLVKTLYKKPFLHTCGKAHGVVLVITQHTWKSSLSLTHADNTFHLTNTRSPKSSFLESCTYKSYVLRQLAWRVRYQLLDILACFF